MVDGGRVGFDCGGAREPVSRGELVDVVAVGKFGGLLLGG